MALSLNYPKKKLRKKLVEIGLLKNKITDSFPIEESEPKQK